MKYHITKVTSTSTKKDGTPLTGKFGPYVRVGVQTQEHGAEWINGFAKTKPDWEGKEVELEITEEEYNGKMQKKFQVPKKGADNGEVMAKLEELHNFLVGIKLQVNGIDVLLRQKKQIESLEEELNPDDVPF